MLPSDIITKCWNFRNFLWIHAKFPFLRNQHFPLRMASLITLQLVFQENVKYHGLNASILKIGFTPRPYLTIWRKILNVIKKRFEFLHQVLLLQLAIFRFFRMSSSLDFVLLKKINFIFQRVSELQSSSIIQYLHQVLHDMATTLPQNTLLKHITFSTAMPRLDDTTEIFESLGGVFKTFLQAFKNFTENEIFNFFDCFLRRDALKTFAGKKSVARNHLNKILTAFIQKHVKPQSKTVTCHFVLRHFNRCNFNRCNFNRSHFQPLAFSTACKFNRHKFDLFN